MLSPVILVSCVKLKRQSPSAAKDLYCSTLFSEMRQFAEANGESWGILSAQYGLLMPEDLVEPYELTLKGMSKQERQDWSMDVWRRLELHLEPSSTVVFLAGKEYREFLVDHLLKGGHKVKIPMLGLSFGRQLNWLQNGGRNWKAT